MKNYPFLRFIGVFLVLIVGFYLFRHLYFKTNYNSGEVAPNFSGELVSGEAFELSDLKGHYILLDFWGSWCGPCMVEIPDLKRLNETYHGASFRNARGFEIVSVSVERDKNRWMRAIEKKELNWKYHLVDLTESYKFFNSEIASLYGVKQVPTKFLIDEKGNIIGVDMPFSEIEAFLKNG